MAKAKLFFHRTRLKIVRKVTDELEVDASYAWGILPLNYYED